MKSVFIIYLSLIYHLAHSQGNKIVEREAPKIIRKYFLYNPVNGRVFSCTKTANQAGRTYGWYHYYEFKGLRWKIESPDSGAGQNYKGCQWQGMIRITATYFRCFTVYLKKSNPSKIHKKWGGWQQFPSGIIYIPIKYADGIWSDFQVWSMNAIQIAGDNPPTYENIRKDIGGDF